MQNKNENISQKKVSPTGGSRSIGTEGKGGSIEIRSEEVQEIMGTPPRWIVRWGITIILLVVVVLIIGSYFYKYPDLISSRVTILSESPPVSIIARSDGKLDKIFVDDKQNVESNELLGIIENPANYQDVYTLIQKLDSVQGYFSEPHLFNQLSYNKEYSLGQYHSYYSSFVSQLKDYQTFLNHNAATQRILSLEKQVTDYHNYIEKIREQISVLRQDYELTFSQFSRDSLLHDKAIMSDVDFENSKASMLKQKYSYQNAMTSLANTQMTVNQLEQQIVEQRVSIAETENKLLATLKERFDNLVNQLKSWEQMYVLKTPIAGSVTFTNFYSKNQFVSSGMVVFTIIPTGEQEIIGRAIIPVKGAGKIEMGQRVNIKLDNYPYMEFGILEGDIVNISMVPVTNEQGSYYTAEIRLRKGLVTNYKKELPFNQEMQGYAEIITKDRRLIERLVEPLVSVFKERF